MTSEPQSQPERAATSTDDALADLQRFGFDNMVGVGAAWIEAFGDLSAEVAGFVADRIKEDVKTQHRILHCEDVGELQQIQAEFIQKAIVQYQAETGKLVEMSANLFPGAGAAKRGS